jgi:tetratricopeptide (TPR) repeat protein
MLAYCRRLSHWLWLLGLAACLGCGTKAEEAVPGDAEYTEGCGLMDEHKTADAVKAFGEAIKQNPQNELAFFQRAEAEQQLSEADEAIDDYTNALRLNPEHADAYCKRGKLFLDGGLAELAIDDLTKACSLAPDSYEAFSLRARARLAVEKPLDAIEDAKMAIRLNVKCCDAYHTLGLALLSDPDTKPERAIDYLRREIHLLSKNDPNLAEAHFMLGTGLDKAEWRHEAEKEFSEAMKLDSEKYLPRYIQYRKRNPLESTRPHTQTSFKPVISELLEQANAALQKGEFDAAIAQFTAVLDKDAKCAEARYGRGCAFLGKGLPDSAIEDLNRAVWLEPPTALLAQVYCERSRAYTEMRNYTQAVRDATAAIQLRPSLAAAFLNRAAAYLAEDRFDRALADLDEAVRLEPQLKPRARDSYAKLYRNQGIDEIAARQWDKAIAGLEKAINLDKQSGKELHRQLAEAYRERGFSFANSGDFEKATHDFETAFKLDEDSAQNHRLCGLTCCKMARICHVRRLTADEKRMWKSAIDHLSRASWLDPELEQSLRYSLDDARRNLRQLAENDRP